MSLAGPTELSSLPPDWEELATKVRQGNCVLFLGADAPNGFADHQGPPSRQELAILLAERCGYSSAALALPSVAQFFESRFQRNSLVDLVRQAYQGQPRYRPSKLHELVARTPFAAIITTRLDTLLEEALQRAGRSYEVVIDSADVPYVSADKLLILKMHGCITRPNSLVLSERDSLDLYRRLPGVLELVRFFFATKHLLYLDYDMEDQEFKYIFHEVLQTVGIHHRRIYAVCRLYPDNMMTLWRDVSIAILESPDSTTFLEDLRKTFQRLPAPRLTTKTSSQPINKSPYKFLDYYTSSDRDIYFGRDVEAMYCWRRVLSHSLVTIFGPSGAGKTSLFLAGVMPELEQEGYQLVYVRAFGNSLDATKSAINLRFGLPIEDGQRLAACVRSASAVASRLVIAVDQFEEVFLSAGDMERQAFYEELAELLADELLDVRVILLLREDFLALLDEARHVLPSVFTNSYRITNLTPSQAVAAISGPARKAGLEVEADLVDKLLSNLDESGIAPPQLQIVCYQLYLDCLERCKLAGKENVRDEKLTLERYEALGGVRQILEDYLDQALDDIAKTDGIIARAIAIEVLKVMVSSQRTKLALSLHEIRASGRAHHIPVKDLGSSLETLVDRRLLRQFERTGTPYFELSHDYLSRRVSTWIGEEEWAAKRIHEMIMREVGNWRESAVLIPSDRFKLIESLKADIARLELEEAELLVRTAFEYGISYKYWLEETVRAGLDAWYILDIVLGRDDPHVRARAVECIGSQSRTQAIEKLRGLLRDHAVQVRERAIEQLEMLKATDAVDELTQLLGDPYPSVEWRSAKALYTIGSYDALIALRDYWPHDMVFIEAGQCLIGSTNEEVQQYMAATNDDVFQNELPRHTVYLDEFLMDKYLVTNADYLKYVEATNARSPGHWIDGNIPVGTEQHPVSQITWSEAAAYAAWAGKRLATEYEWEKAVSWDPRRRIKYRFPWGDEFLRDYCNVNLHPGRPPYVPVGSFSPQGDSPYGVADAIGNGWVWVDGEFAPYPGSTHQDPAYGKGYHIQRSCGGWDNDAAVSFHTAHRVGMPDVANAEVTFRCAMSVVDYLVLAVDKRRRERAEVECD